MYKKYVFSGHESFPCRMLWPIKGYDYIVEKKVSMSLTLLWNWGLAKTW